MIFKLLRKLSLILVLIHAYLPNTYSQVDSIRFSNNDLIVGEIKTMDKGVLKVETDYSDKDFEIEWKQVVWIKTQTRFLITLNDETKYNSNITSINDSIATVYSSSNDLISVNLKKIVYLNSFEEKFLDRFSATIDLGFDMAKARNMRSLSTRSTIGYDAEKWSTDMAFNTLRKDQDDIEEIQRTDGEINFRYILPLRFYAVATQSFLSNTEQNLDLRSNSQAGLGKFFLRTNSAYFGAKTGINRNLEQYSDSLSTKQTSWEGFLGTELNLYDIGDLSLNITIIVYTGLGEWGRLRSDSNINLKYDLPYDFYIRFGSSINYDNQPAEGASELDYVFQFGFGWEW